MSGRHTRIFTSLIAGLAMAVCGTFGAFGATRVSAASYQWYRVLGIYANSADTLMVAVNGRITKVRMIGIDSPEATSRANTKKGCYASQAKLVLKQLVRNGFVRLETDPKMPNTWTDGSLLRYVYSSTGDVGANMIYNGAAKEYMYQHKNYNNRSWYKSLETSATSRRVGMWNLSVCPMNK